MSTRDRVFGATALAALTALSGAFVPGWAQEGPGLGVPATEAAIAGWDISIGPDGEGLPAGSGTVAAGREVYTAKCLACHGAEGQGQPNDPLAGGHGSLSDASPLRTLGSYWPYATTIFDYVRRSMPYTEPQSLTSDEVYAVTAYVLYINDIIDEDDVIDTETLPRVVMPNRDGFVIAWPDWQP